MGQRRGPDRHRLTRRLRTDKEGSVDKVHAMPANRADGPKLGRMVEGARARRALTAKA